MKPDGVRHRPGRGRHARRLHLFLVGEQDPRKCYDPRLRLGHGRRDRLHAGRRRDLRRHRSPPPTRTTRQAASASRTVTVANAAPTATLANGPITYGQKTTVSLTAPHDASAVDAAAGFHYAFALTPAALSGVTYATANGAASADFVGLTAGTYTVYARIIDKDDGYTPYTATLTVNKATLTVTADPKSKSYGAADPGLTYTASGTLYYGDTYAVIAGVSLSTDTGAAATAGTHAIVASGGVAANYNVVDVNGTLTVSKAAALTVTADPKSKVYGAADPTLSYTPSGALYYGDTYAVIGGVALSTTTGASATVGSHAIVASGGDATNYNVVDVNGTLAVNKAAAPLTVTADAKSKIYGAADPTLSYTVTGTTYYGDAAQAVVSGVSLSTDTGAAATAGNHAIVAAGGVAANYNVVDVNGTLAVTPKALTITASDRVKTFGDAVTFAGTEFVSSGLVYADSATKVTLASLGASATAAVGAYAITPSAAVGSGLANYTIALRRRDADRHHPRRVDLRPGCFGPRRAERLGERQPQHHRRPLRGFHVEHRDLGQRLRLDHSGEVGSRGRRFRRRQRPRHRVAGQARLGRRPVRRRLVAPGGEQARVVSESLGQLHADDQAGDIQLDPGLGQRQVDAQSRHLRHRRRRHLGQRQRGHLRGGRDPLQRRQQRPGRGRHDDLRRDRADGQRPGAALGPRDRDLCRGPHLPVAR